MPISENITAFMRRYKEEHHLSIVEFSEELGISKNTVVGCLNGTGNLQSDTIDIIAEKCGVSAAEMISAHSLEWEQAETITRAVKELSTLPPDCREKGLQLFRDMMDLFAGENHS